MIEMRSGRQPRPPRPSTVAPREPLVDIAFSCCLQALGPWVSAKPVLTAVYMFVSRAVSVDCCGLCACLHTAASHTPLGDCTLCRTHANNWAIGTRLPVATSHASLVVAPSAPVGS